MIAQKVFGVIIIETAVEIAGNPRRATATTDTPGRETGAEYDQMPGSRYVTATRETTEVTTWAKQTDKKIK